MKDINNLKQDLDFAKLLQNYCQNKNGHNEDLKAPFYQDGKICATDSYIAIMIQAQNNNFKELEFPKMKNITPIGGIKITLNVKLLLRALKALDSKLNKNVDIFIQDEQSVPLKLIQDNKTILIMPIFNNK